MSVRLASSGDVYRCICVGICISICIGGIGLICRGKFESFCAFKGGEVLLTQIDSVQLFQEKPILI